MIRPDKEFCNCGNSIRYTHGDDVSCNKYVVCPTYEDMRQELSILRKEVSIYKKALTDIINTPCITNTQEVFKYKTRATDALAYAELINK